MKYIEFFKEISAIPRESCNEKAIAEYLMNFADARNLYCFSDEYYNVYIMKPGNETQPPILLQAHTDMVCEKNADKVHDFNIDPVKLIIDGKYIKADGTSLGADNGIGMAFMLALLDENIDMPMIECLFTAQEEIGLVGAEKFDYSIIKSKRMINLDAVNDNEIIISCCGGVRSAFRYTFDLIPCTKIYKTLKIQVTGLLGGHSGIDIHRGRGNANILMGRFLNKLYSHTPFNLVSLNGGIKSNAIARECAAEINVIEPDYVYEIGEVFKNELSHELSENVKIYINKSKTEKMMTYKSTGNIISLLMLCFNGVYNYCKDSPDLVETSGNLGIITQSDVDINFIFFNRSSNEALLDYLCEKADRLSNMLNMEILHSNRYPGWQFDPNSKLLNEYISVCETQPIVRGIHGGLESGVIKNKIEGLDVIAIGPNISETHTPNEYAAIDSCNKIYKRLKCLLTKGENFV
ncbi:MAG: beta-Ala-His dipeptidase [Oscillospiraceae bacterium]|nr:beta-Ala-His dipeptidase [Oscillospiraceae bacterium]